jgi:two-component system, LuxR family, response regulator FixJ
MVLTFPRRIGPQPHARIGIAMNEIFIVDDDPSVRAALATVLGAEGFATIGFADGESFLTAAHSRTPGCVLIDVQLPGCSGLELLKKMDAAHYPAPVLIISGQGDIPTAVEAVRNGALDFIEKPFDPAAVVARVHDAMRAWQSFSADDDLLARDFPGRDKLTAREREVLGRIAHGASNKEAGRELGISPRTIEVHRARIMEKLGAKNATDLMRIVLGKGGGLRHGAAASR